MWCLQVQRAHVLSFYYCVYCAYNLCFPPATPNCAKASTEWKTSLLHSPLPLAPLPSSLPPSPLPSSLSLLFPLHPSLLNQVDTSLQRTEILPLVSYPPLQSPCVLCDSRTSYRSCFDILVQSVFLSIGLANEVGCACERWWWKQGQQK